ncbi:MAG: peptidase M14 [Bacteroidetes bacterium]|nr:peptidase M14 [Bacteroidota bacterium]
MVKFLSIIMLSTTLLAQQSREFTPSALKAMGAPNTPKVEVAWNRYYDTKQLFEIMKRIEKAYPDLVAVKSIGRSVGGKDIWMMTISNRNAGDPDKKPAMYVDGNIHSNEIQGAEVVLYTAWYVTELFDEVEWIRDLLNEKTLYIVPSINPDARDYFIYNANNMHSPRSGLAKRDDDGDGEFDEDGYDDLDGDGNIVFMRIKDPNGRWKEDPSDTRLMVQAGPDEKGTYTLLGWEGIDNDGDGSVNEDNPGFYDPNRDWAWNWAPRYVQFGSDRYPFTFPENQSVRNFFLSHNNIAAAQSFHNNGGMILRGPGSKTDEGTYSRQDIQTYDFLGQLGEEQLPGYKYMVIWKDLYTVYGGEIEWFYGGRGILSFTNELWSEFDYFRRAKDSTRDVSQQDIYRFDRIMLFGEGVVPWKSVRHPQYGMIEVGGIKKQWTRTAPSFMIEDMCHRNMAFTLFHLYHTPKLSVDSIMVKDLPGGLKEVTAVISNSRVIPTHTFQDVKNRITRPDWVSLTGGKVIAGGVLENRFLGILKEQKIAPARLNVENIGGMSSVAVRWIVDGGSSFTVSVDSEKGGTAQRRSR